MGKKENEEEERKPGYGCDLAPKIPQGIVLNDVRNSKWVLGKPIGSGAFGDVYLACKGDVYRKEEADYVIKLEPHSNGPLFTEMHCLVRIGLPEHRIGWKTTEDSPGYVGMPCCHGSGSFHYADQKLRFVVIDKLGSDLEKNFHGGEQPLPLVTVLRIAVQILDTLEFIHAKNYVHNDIKAQNVLTGPTPDTADNVYLVDFGLACKYKNGYGYHKDYEPDERRAHDGTLEYTSRDAHIGAHSRRGDMETLGYNLVHWVSGTLPWIKDMDPEVPENVESQKKFYMTNRVGFLAKCFQPEEYPKVLEDFLDYVADMEFDTVPDYIKIRDMFNNVIKTLGRGSEGKLIFSKPSPKKKVGKRTKKITEDDNARTGFDEEMSLSRGLEEFNIDESSRGGDESQSKRKTRSKIEEGTTDSWNWEEVLKQNPESLGKETRDENNEAEIYAREEEIKRIQLDILANPTPEMCKIMASLKDYEDRRREMSLKDQLAEFNKQRKAEIQARFSALDLTPTENTPMMEEIIARRASRLSKNIPSPENSEPSASVTDDSQEELLLRKKAKIYYKRLRDKFNRGLKNKDSVAPVKRTNVKAKKIASKSKIVKKVIKQRSIGEKGETSLAKSLAMASISTRASSRLHKSSPTLEKSKKLVKKAVEKSKQLRSKVSPKLLRTLRPRKIPDKKNPVEKVDVNKTEVKKQDDEDKLPVPEAAPIPVEKPDGNVKVVTAAPLVFARRSRPTMSEETGPTTVTSQDVKAEQLAEKVSVVEESDERSKDKKACLDEQHPASTLEAGVSSVHSNNVVRSDDALVDMSGNTDNKDSNLLGNVKNTDTSGSAATAASHNVETVASLGSVATAASADSVATVPSADSVATGASADSVATAASTDIVATVASTDIVVTAASADNFATVASADSVATAASTDIVATVASANSFATGASTDSVATVASADSFATLASTDSDTTAASSLNFNNSESLGQIETMELPTKNMKEKAVEQKTAEIELVSTSPEPNHILQASLDETINTLAATRSQLFDSLLSKPSKKPIRLVSEETLPKSIVEPIEPAFVEALQRTSEPSEPVEAVFNPLTVNTDVGSTVQPMFSPDDDDDDDFSSQGLINFDAEPESASFDQTALDRILSALSPSEEQPSGQLNDVAGPFQLTSSHSTMPGVLAQVPAKLGLIAAFSENPGLLTPAVNQFPSNLSSPLVTSVHTNQPLQSKLQGTFVQSTPPEPASENIRTPVVSKTTAIVNPALLETKVCTVPEKSSIVQTIQQASSPSQPAPGDLTSTVSSAATTLTTTTVVSTLSTSKLVTSPSTSTIVPSLKIASLSPNIKDLKLPREVLTLDKAFEYDSPGVSEDILGEKDEDFEPIVSKEKKKRGRKKKVTTPPPLALKVSQGKSQCEHFSGEEDGDQVDDYKSLSRSFSSIKQRLRLLAKDMYTPVNKNRSKNNQERICSPLTLKITKSADGRWKSDSTPNEKIVLKISTGKTKTPKLKIKPVVRNCKTENPRKLKISLKNPRSQVAQLPLDGTPKSRFVPDGWVSFDEVKSKRADAKPEADLHRSRDKNEDKKTKETDSIKIELKPEITSQDVQIIKESSLQNEVMITSPPPAPSSVQKPKITFRTDLFAIKEETPPAPKLEKSILQNQLIDAPVKLENSILKSQLIVSPGHQENPILNQLFASPVQSENSILKNKLIHGRRNLMDMIDSLKEQKADENRLVVLNPVTEDLSDVIDVENNESNMEDIIELDSPNAGTNLDDDIMEISPETPEDVVIEVINPPVNDAAAQKTDVVEVDEGGNPISATEKFPESCYCCPTLECRNSNKTVKQSSKTVERDIGKPAENISVPISNATSNQVTESGVSNEVEPTIPVSQLDQAIASISGATSSLQQHSSNPNEKVSNTGGGIGFLELDQAIASIAELQGSFVNSDMEGSESPYYSNETSGVSEVEKNTCSRNQQPSEKSNNNIKDITGNPGVPAENPSIQDSSSKPSQPPSQSEKPDFHTSTTSKAELIIPSKLIGDSNYEESETLPMQNLIKEPSSSMVAKDQVQSSENMQASNEIVPSESLEITSNSVEAVVLSPTFNEEVSPKCKVTTEFRKSNESHCIRTTSKEQSSVAPLHNQSPTNVPQIHDGKDELSVLESILQPTVGCPEPSISTNMLEVEANQDAYKSIFEIDEDEDEILDKPEDNLCSPQSGVLENSFLNKPNSYVGMKDSTEKDPFSEDDPIKYSEASGSLPENQDVQKVASLPETLNERGDTVCNTLLADLPENQNSELDNSIDNNKVKQIATFATSLNDDQITEYAGKVSDSEINPTEAALEVADDVQTEESIVVKDVSVVPTIILDTKKIDVFEDVCNINDQKLMEFSVDDQLVGKPSEDHSEIIRNPPFHLLERPMKASLGNNTENETKDVAKKDKLQEVENQPNMIKTLFEDEKDIISCGTHKLNLDKINSLNIFKTSSQNDKEIILKHPKQHPIFEDKVAVVEETLNLIEAPSEEDIDDRIECENDQTNILMDTIGTASQLEKRESQSEDGHLKKVEHSVQDNENKIFKDTLEVENKPEKIKMISTGETDNQLEMVKTVAEEESTKKVVEVETVPEENNSMSESHSDVNKLELVENIVEENQDEPMKNISYAGNERLENVVVEDQSEHTLVLENKSEEDEIISKPKFISEDDYLEHAAEETKENHVSLMEPRSENDDKVGSIDDLFDQTNLLKDSSMALEQLKKIESKTEDDNLDLVEDALKENQEKLIKNAEEMVEEIIPFSKISSIGDSNQIMVNVTNATNLLEEKHVTDAEKTLEVSQSLEVDITSKDSVVYHREIAEEILNDPAVHNLLDNNPVTKNIPSVMKVDNLNDDSMKEVAGTQETVLPENLSAKAENLSSGEIILETQAKGANLDTAITIADTEIEEAGKCDLTGTNIEKVGLSLNIEKLFETKNIEPTLTNIDRDLPITCSETDLQDIGSGSNEDECGMPNNYIVTRCAMTEVEEDDAQDNFTSTAVSHIPSSGKASSESDIKIAGDINELNASDSVVMGTNICVGTSGKVVESTDCNSESLDENLIVPPETSIMMETKTLSSALESQYNSVQAINDDDEVISKSKTQLHVSNVLDNEITTNESLHESKTELNDFRRKRKIDEVTKVMSPPKKQKEESTGPSTVARKVRSRKPSSVDFIDDDVTAHIKDKNEPVEETTESSRENQPAKITDSEDSPDLLEEAHHVSATQPMDLPGSMMLEDEIDLVDEFSPVQEQKMVHAPCIKTSPKTKKAKKDAPIQVKKGVAVSPPAKTVKQKDGTPPKAKKLESPRKMFSSGKTKLKKGGAMKRLSSEAIRSKRLIKKKKNAALIVSPGDKSNTNNKNEASSIRSPFKKPLIGIVERRESAEIKLNLNILKPARLERKRKDSTSSNVSSASDTSTRSRSRHESSSSNNSETSVKEKPKSKARMLENLDKVPILSRRKGRKGKRVRSAGDSMTNNIQKRAVIKKVKSTGVKCEEDKSVKKIHNPDEPSTKKAIPNSIGDKSVKNVKESLVKESSASPTKLKNDDKSMKIGPREILVKKKSLLKKKMSKGESIENKRETTTTEKVDPKECPVEKQVSESKDLKSKIKAKNTKTEQATEENTAQPALKKVLKKRNVLNPNAEITGNATKTLKKSPTKAPTLEETKEITTKPKNKKILNSKKASTSNPDEPKLKKKRTTEDISHKSKLNLNVKTSASAPNEEGEITFKNNDKASPKKKRKTVVATASKNDDSDDDTDVETEGTIQVMVDDEITLNIPDTGIGIYQESSPKKMKVSTEEVSDRIKSDKPKKKIVGSGKRKGRSGANTRSTNLHL